MQKVRICAHQYQLICSYSWCTYVRKRGRTTINWQRRASATVGAVAVSLVYIDRLAQIPPTSEHTLVNYLASEGLLSSYMPTGKAFCSGSILELVDANLDLILLFTCRRAFSLFPFCVLGEPSLGFVGSFFVRTTSVLSSSTYCKHTPAQPISHAQRSKASTRRRERDNASQQTKLARTSMYSINSLYSQTKRTKTQKSARPRKKVYFRTRRSSWHLQIVNLHPQSNVGLSVRFPRFLFSSL